ncbi:SLAC1 anion channel family protein [Rhodocista pekingensis]|uniref:SLAC1 anion channel family protein n=1 Tax=Rhodocista pekingensis TaxID=201185 RepID=A0ABW2KYF6_9PROT
MTVLPASHAPASWVAHVPLPLFATVMGVGGLGLAWRKAHTVLGLPAAVGEGLLALAALLFVVVGVLYLLKVLRHPEEAAAESRHPVRVNFYPAATIGLMILAGGLLPYHPAVAEGLWLAGAVGQIALAGLIIGRWITREQQIATAGPAWFIPVVGNILAPVVGVPLGHTELSWFLFSVGLLFWLVLFPVVLNRILFHGMMPARLLPTLAILVAPPSVGFLSWLALNGGVLDAAARILLGPAVFLAAILLSRARSFRNLPFAVSWWAFTFPSAALALACLRLAELHGTVQGGVLQGPAWAAGLAAVTLLLATVIVATVAARTLMALLGGTLFSPE